MRPSAGPATRSFGAGHSSTRRCSLRWPAGACRRGLIGRARERSGHYRGQRLTDGARMRLATTLEARGRPGYSLVDGHDAFGGRRGPGRQLAHVRSHPRIDPTSPMRPRRPLRTPGRACRRGSTTRHGHACASKTASLPSPNGKPSRGTLTAEERAAADRQLDGFIGRQLPHSA